MICPSCLKDTPQGFCPPCRRKLFGGKPVNPHLPYASPKISNTDPFGKLLLKVAIPGNQLKFPLKIGDGDAGGKFILKIPPPNSLLRKAEVPANEHLTMQIAEQIFKLPTPPNALVKFKDNSTAFLVKRFDMRPNGTKVQQEDMAQLAKLSPSSVGKGFKYHFSYEAIGELLKQHVAAYKVEVERFFRLVIFDFLFSNGEGHLKKFSVQQTVQRDYVLCPAYGLRNTRLHNPESEELALPLLIGGKPESFARYGFYSYADFRTLGLRLGMSSKRVEKNLSFFLADDVDKKIERLVNRAFLSAETRQIYREHYTIQMGKFIKSLY